MTDTIISNLVINKLTRALYDEIENPSDTELYLIPDEIDSTPTSGSDNLITSDGVYNAISNKIDKISSSTDNAIVRFDGTSGNILNSGVTINDSDHVTAVKFIKSGGTSSQFLKADGSVDSTSYGTYSKPSGGIPKTDLASAVQTSLGKADTALLSHLDISGKENTSNKVTSLSSSSTDTQYPSAKCVYDAINADAPYIIESTNGVAEKSVSELLLLYFGGTTNLALSYNGRLYPFMNFFDSNSMGWGGLISQTNFGTNTQIITINLVGTNLEFVSTQVNIVKSVNTTTSNGINLSNTNGTLDVTVTPGSVANGDTGLVTGGTVYNAIQAGKAIEVRLTASGTANQYTTDISAPEVVNALNSGKDVYIIIGIDYTGHVFKAHSGMNYGAANDVCYCNTTIDLNLNIILRVIKHSGTLATLYTYTVAGRIPIILHGTSDTSYTITPNLYHKWGSVSSLTITLQAINGSSVLEEYLFSFTSPSIPTTLSVPASVKWVTPLDILANKEYRISIIDNLATWITSDMVVPISDVNTPEFATKAYVNASLAFKENSSNKTTSVDENSTDTQYPSAKAVYDAINQN